ncbi:hypothetical protein [Rhizobium gallicum]|uniref:hypothetical protein n=1 Tax=Rhizobium gallicum TaxID=56730 RepID=UPI001EF762EA|nr:hypothetical protein [Rhizobium gallicum]ULJ75781.1 hypothetical protein L2W42_24970 [Rhizobium gallicum]
MKILASQPSPRRKPRGTLRCRRLLVAANSNHAALPSGLSQNAEAEFLPGPFVVTPLTYDLLLPAIITVIIVCVLTAEVAMLAPTAMQAIHSLAVLLT